MGNNIKIQGDKALFNLLRQLPKRVESKINRRAVTKATAPMLRACKREAPVDHGDLRKSMIKKITNRGAQANGIIGADAGYIAEDGEIPSDIDHLVNYGHLNPDGSMTVANPFLQRGFDASIDEGKQIHEATLAEGVEVEALKLGN